MITILTGDAIEQLRTLPGESVQCCVTSPPYWGLRDYGTAAWEGGDAGCDHIAPAGVSGGQRADRTFTLGEIYKSECGKCGARRIDSQLGLEKTPDEYVAKMVEVFREVRRVLRKDGTLWLNLGDSYGHGTSADRQQSNNPGVGANCPEAQNSVGRNGLKAKDLCGIPWRVAFALQADGWWLRSDIIWAKPNPMPESVTDRPTKAHEYLFLLTKSASYFYDAEAIKEKNQVSADWQEPEPRLERAEVRNGLNPVKGQIGFYHLANPGNGRNKRSVWTVATAPYPEAHFATYPPDLIKPCIMAGTSAKGCCAKCGAPWERVVERSSYERDHTDPKKLGTLEHHQSRGSGGNEGMIQSGAKWNQFKAENPDKTLGWQPTCGHFGAHGSKWKDEHSQSSGHRIQKNMNALRAEGRDHDNPFPPKITTGWEGTCDCAADVVPCTVLDPFAGSGTTGAVALELGRKAVLIELNPKYVELIRQRCDVTIGLALA